MENNLFPQIEEDMANTLVIIGNGFDKAHGIESGYWDFRSWVAKQDNQRLIILMDTFFSGQHDFWGNVELSLGEYDEDSILDFCKPDHEFDYDHSLSSSARVEDAPDAIFTPAMREFSEAFTSWVDSIDIREEKKIRDLPLNAKYLTFNYTDTLETVYHIPREHVLHIHGNRIAGDKYIFGHDNYRNEDDIYADDAKLYYEQNALAAIVKTMNGYKKDTANIIKQHSDFFYSLSDINQVVVYGLSYSQIDMPYLREVVIKIGTHVPWSMSWYCQEDYKRIHSFVTAAGLKNVKSFHWVDD